MNHAPPGGISVNGDWYDGGQFLPQNDFSLSAKVRRVQKDDSRRFRCRDRVRNAFTGEGPYLITWIDWRNDIAELFGDDGRITSMPLRQLEILK